MLRSVTESTKKLKRWAQDKGHVHVSLNRKQGIGYRKNKNKEQQWQKCKISDKTV